MMKMRFQMSIMKNAHQLQEGLPWTIARGYALPAPSRPPCR